METKDSITARPWFICPSWAAVAPLLADAIARNGDEAARAELMRLAEGADQWNKNEQETREALRWFLNQLADDSAIDMAQLINGMEARARAALANLEAAE
jgi:hypothetical protein